MLPKLQKLFFRKKLELAPLNFLIGTRPNRPSEKSRNCSGFTFVELLVVLAIIGLITTIGIASYNSFNEQRVLDKTAYELKNQLRLARSRAISGEKDCETCGMAGSDGICGTDDDTGGTSVLDGWYADFANLWIYGSCGSTSFSQKTLVEIPAGVSMSVTGSIPTNTLQFKPLGQGTNLTGSVIIEFSGFVTKTSQVTIDPSGEVE